MHELSVCQAIVDTVRDHAGGRPLRQVNVRIGHLRQVVPDSLLFSWEILTEDSELAGCTLAVEHIAAVIGCRGCGVETELDRPLMVCPACEGHDVEVLRGEEFQIASIDVVEEVC
ncbi:MAG TPA: hydrogenase maturation nickel metallochaperone HypA [Acidimicrobiales bacterium]|nr:hydrogenase maturation nickel metallochaperone HypA [Acidimicrobiales bacterium]